ncbi:MAG: TonB-dependent receptor plug domain-containing protein, partial [Longimicrobiales bacterium]
RGLATLGDSSITGPQDPLFIVDGTPVDARAIETALAGLTRQDIRQVDVLKDVASTSIYGTRGVGGVIVITTRR